MTQHDIVAHEGDLFWEVPEYEKHERTKNWYISAVAIDVFLVIYAIFGLKFWRFDLAEFNPLFLGIIILGTIVMFMNDKEEPRLLPVILGEEGIQLGLKFYDYDEIKNFSIVFKPRDGVKNIYLEFKSVARPRLTIPLMEQDPLVVREALLRYLPEDLDRTNPPASEGLAKILKL